MDLLAREHHPPDAGQNSEDGYEGNEQVGQEQSLPQTLLGTGLYQAPQVGAMRRGIHRAIR